MNVQLLKAIRGAIRDGALTEFNDLINTSPDAIRMNTAFGPWLHVAASLGQLSIVKDLVERGVDVNARGGISGGNALNEAASEGHYDVVKFLLDSGAQMDTAEPERNPLFSAIYGGHLAVGKLLIERGIDTKVSYTGESMKNMDALAFAEERVQTEFVELLKNIR
jgi:uncharacterized protein